jgi:hypothetical protein
MTTETIQSMSLTEQVETMERLWDSICHAGKEPKSPVWHEQVVRERQQRYRSGEAETVSLKELKKPKRFPFAIYYKLEEEGVVVNAILDMRRKPNTIRNLVAERSTTDGTEPSGSGAP